MLQGNANSAASLAKVMTTGLFAFQQSKGLREVTDGMSNTVAFAESTVGSEATAPRTKLVGFVNLALPAAAVRQNAFIDPQGVKSGIAFCSATWIAGTAPNDNQRGECWAQGAMAMTLFNTVAPPTPSPIIGSIAAPPRGPWPISATPGAFIPGGSMC